MSQDAKVYTFGVAVLCLFVGMVGYTLGAESQAALTVDAFEVAEELRAVARYAVQQSDEYTGRLIRYIAGAEEAVDLIQDMQARVNGYVAYLAEADQ